MLDLLYPDTMCRCSGTVDSDGHFFLLRIQMYLGLKVPGEWQLFFQEWALTNRGYPSDHIRFVHFCACLNECVSLANMKKHSPPNPEVSNNSLLLIFVHLRNLSNFLYCIVVKHNLTKIIPQIIMLEKIIFWCIVKQFVIKTSDKKQERNFVFISYRFFL